MDFLLLLKPTRIFFTHAAFWGGITYALYLSSSSIPISIVFSIAAFLLLYGAIYIMNDLFDLKEDRKDPILSKRLIASNRVSEKHAKIEMLVVIATALLLAAVTGPKFLILSLVFLVMNIIYSSKLKRIAYVDILFMALSHPLKFFAGTLVVGSSLTIYSMIPILLFVYAAALVVHSEKQLVRVLQNRKRSFELGSYNESGLLLTALLLPVIQTFAFFFIEPRIFLIMLVSMIFYISIFVLLLFNSVYRRWRIGVEINVSKK